MEKLSNNNSRHMGLEVLRLAAMLSIVFQHVLVQGGVLYEAAVGDSTLKYLLCHVLQTFTLCGTDIFALITGYFCIHSGGKMRTLIKVWMQTVFYMAVVCAVFYFVDRGKLMHITLDQIIFPITNRKYWYISCYAMLVIVMPLLNAAIKGCKKETLLGFILVFAFVSGVMAPIFSDIDSFTVNNGYSPWHLAFMYLIGAYIRLHGEEKLGKISPWLLFGVLFCSGLVPKIVKAAEIYLRPRYGATPLVEYLAQVCLRLQERSCIFLMLVSVCAFLLFLRLHPKKGHGLINFLSRHSLGVYLLHVQPVLFGAAYYVFAPLAHLNMFVMALAVLGVSLAVFFVSIAVDWLRGLLFALLRLDKLGVKLGDGIESALGKLVRKI